MDTLYRMFRQQFHCKPECTWLEQQGRAHYRGYCWLNVWIPGEYPVPLSGVYSSALCPMDTLWFQERNGTG